MNLTFKSRLTFLVTSQLFDILSRDRAQGPNILIVLKALLVFLPTLISSSSPSVASPSLTLSLWGTRMLGNLPRSSSSSSSAPPYQLRENRRTLLTRLLCLLCLGLTMGSL